MERMYILSNNVHNFLFIFVFFYGIIEKTNAMLEILI